MCDRNYSVVIRARAEVQPPTISFMEYVADAYAASTPGGALSATSGAQAGVSSGRVSSEHPRLDAAGALPSRAAPRLFIPCGHELLLHALIDRPSRTEQN